MTGPAQRLATARDFVGYGDSARRRVGPKAPASPCNSPSTTRKVRNTPLPTATAAPNWGSPKRRAVACPTGQRDLAFETMYEFGSRVGVWRLLPLFSRAGAARHLVWLRARSRAQSACG